MKYYLILGPSHENTTTLQLHANDVFQIYGNGTDKINCKDIQLAEDDHVTIQAHGYEDRGGHYIALCNDTEQKSALFSDSIQELSNGKIIHVELFSCYSGAAIHDISYLPIGSTLMTFTSAKHESLVDLEPDIFAESRNFEHLDNPFIKFASYLFTNPDDTQFALHSKAGSKIFSASIKTIESFASTEIIKWQNKQLVEFLKFCQNIQSDVTEKNAAQIAELLDLFKEDHCRDNWFKKFDVKRYQELLLILSSYVGNKEFVHRLLSGFLVDVNCKTNDGISPLWIAAHKGEIDIVVELIEAGANINDKDDFIGYYPLHLASDEGYIDVVVTLIAAGANVNAQTNAGYYPLHLAVDKKNIDVIATLIRAGANVNANYNGGETVLERACDARPNIVEMLLSSGANTVEAKLCKKYGSENILKKIETYNLDPIKYILQNHVEAHFALNSMRNVELQFYNEVLKYNCATEDFESHIRLAKLLPLLDKTIDCLEAQPDGVIENLVEICGAQSLHTDEF